MCICFKSGGDFCSLGCGVPLTSRQRLGGLSFEAPSLALVLAFVPLRVWGAALSRCFGLWN